MQPSLAYDESKIAILRAGTKLYAIHSNLPQEEIELYLTASKAILAHLILYYLDGVFGQKLGVHDEENVALENFHSVSIDKIVTGKIATALEFLSYDYTYLSEFVVTDDFKYTPTILDQNQLRYGRLISNELVGNYYLALIKQKLSIPLPEIIRNGKSIEANETLLKYYDLVQDIINERTPIDTLTLANYEIEMMKIARPQLEGLITETGRYAINWEILALSFVAFVSAGANFEKMEKDLPAVFKTFLIDVTPKPPSKPTIQAIINPPIKTALALPSVMQSVLTPVTGQQVQCNIVTGSGPLAQIICGQLSIGPSWKEVIETNRCTIKGYKIAESLIKVAATRIFSIPEQSIMEPIVNGLDAYNPARKIGKFGMGFFSLMYWVVQDPKASLTITSVYRGSNFIRPCGYEAKIFNQDGELYVTVKEIATSSVISTGFRVELAFGSPMDDETLTKFNEQLSRLKYVTSALITVNRDYLLNSQALAIRQQTESQLSWRPNQTVQVALDRYGFIIEDKATGLPIENFYSTLIVPSISSKTISLSATKEAGFIDRSTVVRKDVQALDADYDSFRITIGEIVVVDIKFRSNFIQTVTVLMTLPLQTKVPVSRDDVLLTSVADEAKAAMLKLLQTDISIYSDTSYVEEALLAFTNETASSENIEIIKTFLDSIPQRLRQMNLVGIPVTEPAIYMSLNQRRNITGRRYILTLNYDQSWLEEQLRLQEVSYDNFFLNKRVIFVKLPRGTLASNGGTSSFIFVDSDYPRTVGEGVEWPAALATQHKRDILYPAGTKFGESLSKAVLQYTETFRDSKSRLLMETLAGKYQAALDLREAKNGTIQNYLSVQIPIMIQYLKTLYYSIYAPDDFHAIIGSLITILDNLQPLISVYGERLTIKCVNTLNLDDLIKISQITFSRIIHPNGSVKDFKKQLFSGIFDLEGFVNQNQELHAKTGRYQIAFIDRAVKLAIQRKYTNFAQVDPFSAGYELNLMMEVLYVSYMLNHAKGEDIIIVNCFLALLRESANAFQFILSYLLMHVLFTKLDPNARGGLKVPTYTFDLLITMRKVSKTPLELGSKLAMVILSTITREFGVHPTTRIYTFHRLIMNGGVYDVLNSSNIFDAYFQELYRPTLDVYTWMEKTAAISGLIQEIPRGIPDSNEIECYRFTLSKLVEFVFQEELPATNLDLFRSVSRFKSKIPSRLQIIQLAINFG